MRLLRWLLGTPTARGLEVAQRPFLVVALNGQDVVDQVGDLLVVHGPAVADAPGRHRGRRPALLDRLPGDGGDVLVRVPDVDLVQVGSLDVGRLGPLYPWGDVALDRAALGVGAVAALAELLEGGLAEPDRLGQLLAGRGPLAYRLAQVQEGQEQGQEHGQRDPGDLVPLQQRALEGLVGGAGPARRRGRGAGPPGLLPGRGDHHDQREEQEDGRDDGQDQDGGPAHRSGLPAADAVGAVQLLAGGVGPPGRAGDDLGGVDHDLAARRLDGEAVEAARGRSLLVLAGLVVLGAVAGALPPLGGGAPRDPAAEMDATLVQGHAAAAGDAAVDALGVVLLVVGDEVEAAVGDIGVAVVGLDVGVDRVGVAGPDLAAEPFGQVGPQ